MKSWLKNLLVEDKNKTKFSLQETCNILRERMAAYSYHCSVCDKLKYKIGDLINVNGSEYTVVKVSKQAVTVDYRAPAGKIKSAETYAALTGAEFKDKDLHLDVNYIRDYKYLDGTLCVLNGEMDIQELSLEAQVERWFESSKTTIALDPPEGDQTTAEYCAIPHVVYKH